MATASNHPGVIAQIEAAKEKQPQLTIDDTFYWTSYQTLHRDRPTGMGVSPIPFASIHTYAIRYDIEGDDFDYFVEVMQVMDNIQLAHEAAKQPKAKQK